jgi:hypothetical protein
MGGQKFVMLGPPKLRLLDQPAAISLEAFLQHALQPSHALE